MVAFEVVLNSSQDTWLNHHRILGKCIFPAAGYIELLLANCDFTNATENFCTGIQMEKIKFLKPMIFHSAEDKTIKITLPEPDSSGSFQIESNASQGMTDTHLEGYLGYIQKRKQLTVNCEDIKKRCCKRLDGKELYSRYTQAGIEYGPFFRSVQNVWYDESAVLAEIHIDNGSDHPDSQFYLHPALLDGAFQSTGIFSLVDKADSMYMPFSIDRIMIYNLSSPICFSYSRIIKKEKAGSQTQKFEIALCDSNGAVHIEIDGFSLKSLPKKAALPKSHLIYTDRAQMSAHKTGTIAAEREKDDVGDVCNQRTIKQAGRYPIPTQWDGKMYEKADKDKPSANDQYRDRDIAVIGVAGRFPHAENLDAFWDTISNGKTAVSEVPLQRWDIDQVYDDNPDAPGKTNCRFGCFLKDIDRFDPMLFGISVNKAKYIDPQQRLMLETVYQTIEDAGYGNKRLSKTRTGVYIGVCHNEYVHRGGQQSEKLLSHVASGNTSSAIANRISYYFDFTGPSMAIDTACSSSLTALYYAVRDILDGACLYALVGGVNLTLSASTHVIFSKLGVLSADGMCRPFDKKATGYVRGEGVGAILLKPLKPAIADRDNIHAVIKGAAINHTGKTNGFNSPSAVSETSVITDALQKAHLHPETISYIETHGTGTTMGDQIEFRGLANAFKNYTAKRGYCALSSIKPNIGHLESASGIASVIKTILALKKKKIPPLIHFKTPNTKIDFINSPFYICDRQKDWNSSCTPRRAAVSSFGFGGTNTHVLFEEYERTDNHAKTERLESMVTLSANSMTAAKNLIGQVVAFLNNNSDTNLINVCGTLNSGRDHHKKFRLAIVGSTHQEIADALKMYVSDKKMSSRMYVSETAAKNGKIAFVFANADNRNCRELFDTKPSFRKIFQEWEHDIHHHVRENDMFPENITSHLPSFISGLAVSSILLRYGIVPHVVGGVGTGRYSASLMLHCGMKAYQSALPMITVNKNSFHIRSVSSPGEMNASNKENEFDYSSDDIRAWLQQHGYSLIIDPMHIGSWKELLDVVARAYTHGVTVDWDEYYTDDTFCRISLPTYPFKRTQYWLE